MAFTAKILSWRFSPPEYCRLFAQKKAYQGGVTGTPGPPPSYAPAAVDKKLCLLCCLDLSVSPPPLPIICHNSPRVIKHYYI